MIAIKNRLAIVKRMSFAIIALHIVITLKIAYLIIKNAVFIN